MLDFLTRMGARIEQSNNTVTVRQSRLKPVSADLTDCIDLLPTMAVVAVSVRGQSELTGISRARLKESDRVAAVKDGLERMGITVKEEENRLTINGGSIRGAVTDPRNDHRIAMAFSILGTVAGETVINNAECVTKTYPDFWKVLRSIGGEVVIDGE
jgi:3-phosphoshikimate 1-carboxyvinyltransferase